MKSLKNIRVPFIGILFLAPLIIGCQQQKLREFIPSSRKFSILLPGTPSEEVSSGVIKTYNYSLTQSNVTYLISYSESPPFAYQNRTPERLQKELDLICSMCASGPMHARIIRELTSGIYNGKEMEIQNPSSEITRLIVFITYHGSYQITVSAAKSKAFSEGIQNILDSFQILSD